MFDRIAQRYDLLNRVLSAGTDVRWRRRAVDALELRAPARVLDVCTGTADLLIEVLRRDPRHCGLGCDLSCGMLLRGARKLDACGLRGRAALVSADAASLPVRDGTFDGALVGFGIRNVGEPLRALRELRRVLRPGGRLVVLEFSSPQGVFGRLYRLYFRHLLPRLAGLLSEGTAYEYLPASVARFPSADGFARLVCEAGFTGVGWRLLSGGIACLHWGEKLR